MRQKIEVPAILEAGDRVPAQGLSITEEKLIELYRQSHEFLSDFLRIAQTAPEELYKLLDVNEQESLQTLPEAEQFSAMVSSLRVKRWKPIAEHLAGCLRDDFEAQATSFILSVHLLEISYENTEEHRLRIGQLTQEAFTIESIASAPILPRVNQENLISVNEFKLYLDELYTETLKNAYRVIDRYDHGVAKVLHQHLFNDNAPTKFPVSLLEKYVSQTLAGEEALEFAKTNPAFFLNELLSQRSNIIENNPKLTESEKVTQKAAVYQLLKEIFLNNEEKPQEKDPRRLKKQRG